MENSSFYGLSCVGISLWAQWRSNTHSSDIDAGRISASRFNAASQHYKAYTRSIFQKVNTV